jgi:hypothetical protein
MAGDIILFSLAGPVGYDTGNIIYQSLGGPWSSGKIYAPGNPVRAFREAFVSGNFAGFSLYISSEGSAKLRWVGRG